DADQQSDVKIAEDLRHVCSPLRTRRASLTQVSGSIEPPHHALLERRPEAHAHAPGAQGGAGPGVTVVEHREGTVAFVESVGAGIAAGHVDRRAVLVEAEAGADISGEAPILVRGQPDRPLPAFGLRAGDMLDMDER